MIWIAPRPVTWPVLPPTTPIPTALFESAIPIAPSILTVLLEFSVTAVPLATFTDPVAVMLTLSGCPVAAVAVAIGVVTAVEMSVSACATPARKHRGEAAARRR